MAGSSSLPRAVLRFVERLRLYDLRVTTGAVIDAVRALELVDISDREEVRRALRTILTTRVEEHPLFDRCFAEFWSGWEEGEDVAAFAELTNREEEGEEKPLLPTRPTQLSASVDEEAGVSEERAADLSGSSERESMIEKDFSTFSAEQLDEVARLTAAVARHLAKQLSRRRQHSRKRDRVDLRRTLRTNLKDGDIIRLCYRARVVGKLRLVVLCDVSGSMDVYSRFLLQFVYALQNAFGRVETFTFATRLTRVSELLRGASYAQLATRLGEVRDWSGGTLIGGSLREFNVHWGQLVDQRTVVLIVSDGWDVGEPDLLASEVLSIKRKAGRVIWLNPLLGRPSYQPLNRGMSAALPYVDDFLAAHNLASLRDLVRYLAVR